MREELRPVAWMCDHGDKFITLSVREVDAQDWARTKPVTPLYAHPDPEIAALRHDIERHVAIASEAETHLSQAVELLRKLADVPVMYPCMIEVRKFLADLDAQQKGEG